MKGIFELSSRLAAMLVASAALTLAQGAASNSAATASARTAQVGPGMVNYVEGQATVNGHDLSAQSAGYVTLGAGGVLDTGDGYAEVLLTPGAFLRVGHNSEIRLGRAGLVNTTVDLLRGAADVEVEQIVNGSHIIIDVNNTPVEIAQKGLYAFSAAQNSVRVLDGKAAITDDGKQITLGKGHQAVLAAGAALPKRESFDEKQAKTDPLYIWSRIRSQDLAQASYAAASNASAYGPVNNGWFWNPYAGFYGFWPADAYLYSPFGYGFYSPLYFGYGYGLGYGPYYGRGFNRGYYHRGFAGRVNTGAFNGHAVSGFQGAGGFHSVSGGGFHSAGGGFHGGGGRR